jgi:hypothetical protein
MRQRYQSRDNEPLERRASLPGWAKISDVANSAIEKEQMSKLGIKFDAARIGFVLIATALAVASVPGEAVAKHLKHVVASSRLGS